MPLRGVIFDMDGTLTEPAIDFAEMRRRVGIPSGDILITIRGWPEERQREAFAIIDEIEELARAKLAVQPGVHELMEYLDARGLPKGIITRNTEKSVRHLQRFIRTTFSVVLTRGFHPVKPDPAPVRHICGQWGVPTAEVLMVGDYRDDLVCGKAAGARACLLLNDRNSQWAELADFAVPDFYAMRGLVQALVEGSSSSAPGPSRDLRDARREE